MWRRRTVVVAIVGALVALALLFSVVADSSFRATALLSVEDPRATSIIDQGTAQRPERYVADQAAIIQSELVLLPSVDALREAGVDIDLDTLQDDLIVLSSEDSNLIQLVYEDANGPRVVEIVNTVAEQYQAVLAENKTESVQSAIAQIEISIDEASNDLTEIEAEIGAIIDARQGRSSLDLQFEENLARFAALQERLAEPATSADARAQIRAEIDDLLAQFDTLQAIQNLETSDLALSSLLAEQNSVITRQSELLATRDGLRADAELSSAGVTLFSPAQIPELVEIGRVSLLALALIVGLIVAAAIAYILDIRFRALSDRSEPENVLGAPMLADIPDFNADGIETDAPVAEAPESATAEAYGFAAASIERKLAARGGEGAGGRNAVVVTGPMVGSGRTTSVLNMGLAAAKRGKRVLLVDADVSNPDLSRMLLDFDTLGGLNVERTRRSPSHIRIRVAGTALDLLTNGTTVVPSQGTARELAVEDLLGRIPDDYYDLVLIDTAPLAQASYVASVIGSADYTVVTLKHGTRVAPVEEATDRLEALGTRAAGYIYVGTGSRRRVGPREPDIEPDLSQADGLRDAG
jgi:tyrosine-protein kinase Etk/Wzc